MRIVVAHSPDSDDAFMFYGLASGAVQTGGIEIEQVLSDIETLNRAAFEGKYEVSAVSFHAYAHLTDKYALLPHGASMGDDYGPMVIVRKGGPRTLDGLTVAIPGTLTSAWLALQLYERNVKYTVMPFDEILEAVRDGKAEAGLIIHEGQLTYADEGLEKIVDLGEWWFDITGGLPLPLGCNVIRRDLGPDLMRQTSRILHESIKYGLEHRADGLKYASQFGRGLDASRTDRFVGMYVNQLTLGYGDRGKEGVRRFLDDAWDAGLLPAKPRIDFVE